MNFLIKLKNYIWTKHFAKHFGLVILVYLVIYFSVNWILSYSTNHGQKIEVPDLVGKNQNNIDNLIGNSGLVVEVLDSIYDPTKVEGTILEQDPSPTKISQVYVKEGRKIKIRVSKRTQLVEMPDLIYKSQRFAETILRNRGFRYNIEYRTSSEAHGAVIEQMYKGKKILKGKKIPIGSTVKLIVGRDEGGIPLELPNLYGMTIGEARMRVEAMLNMEFLIACDDCITKADSLSARVFSQSPEYTEAAVIASGSSILVNASKNFSPEPE